MQSIRNLLWISFGVIFLSSFLLMGFQNSELIRLKFLVWQTAQLPFSYFVFAGFSAGVLFAGFMALFEIVTLQRRLRKARRMRELLEREIDALRNQPLYDEPPTPEKTTSNGSEEGLAPHSYSETTLENR